MATRQGIAELLRSGKEEVARVKVEAIIRDDLALEAFEIIELFLELVLSRVGMIKMQAGVPFDLKEVRSQPIFRGSLLTVHRRCAPSSMWRHASMPRSC